MNMVQPLMNPITETVKTYKMCPHMKLTPQVQQFFKSTEQWIV